MLSNDLTETTASLDLDNLPANQLNKYYEIRLVDYKREDEKESQILYSVNVSIKFTFGIYKKNVSEYQDIIDTYIHGFIALLKNRNTSGNVRIPYTSSGVTISKIAELEVKGLNEIVKGNYLQPEITAKFLIIE